jgi:superfamily II DNA or RNA helicase
VILSCGIGPVRHALDQSEESTLIDVTSEPSVPDRELYVHETTLVLDDIDPSMPGAIAAAHHLLAADESRNAQIVKDVDHAISRGRNCLVLTRRVVHLEILTNHLAALGHQALVLQGGMSAKARRAVVDRLADAQVGDGVLVIGTTPFIGEGFDAPALDTLFLAAPIAFDGLLVQCAGRVVRAAPGKDLAEVHDYHDPAVPLLAGALRRRMPGYRALRFTRRS